MFKRIKRYLSEVKGEWAKVSKPTYEEVWGSTVVVIATTAVLILYLWLIDVILKQGRTLFLG